MWLLAVNEAKVQHNVKNYRFKFISSLPFSHLNKNLWINCVNQIIEQVKMQSRFLCFTGSVNKNSCDHSFKWYKTYLQYITCTYLVNWVFASILNIILLNKMLWYLLKDLTVINAFLGKLTLLLSELCSLIDSALQ